MPSAPSLLAGPSRALQSDLPVRAGIWFRSPRAKPRGGSFKYLNMRIDWYLDRALSSRRPARGLTDGYDRPLEPGAGQAEGGRARGRRAVSGPGQPDRAQTSRERRQIAGISAGRALGQRRKKGGSLAQDRRHEEGRGGQGGQHGAHQPTRRPGLGPDGGLEPPLLLRDLEQRVLHLAERTELLLDVPELPEPALDLVGATHELDMTPLELRLDRDQ